jgi:dynein heavy chain
MTNEPPKGIRANLLRSYQNLVKPEDFDTCAKSDAFKRILSALCFFHGNILERRKFGPLGWNIRYAFDESDLETSINVMRRFLDEQESIPWDALRFITGHINYGGRVTDDWDRRCIVTILSIYFNEAIMVQENGEYKPHSFSRSGLYEPVWKSNVTARSTPSTRRRPRDRVGSMAWRFYAIDASVLPVKPHRHAAAAVAASMARSASRCRDALDAPP